MIQFLGKAIISFAEKIRCRGMSRHLKLKKIKVNIFNINEKAYYGIGKNKAYPLDELFNYPIKNIMFY